jgi:transcription elongation factor GreA
MDFRFISGPITVLVGEIPIWILIPEGKMTTSFLTRDGYQKLQDELDFLRTQKREEIANRLHEAMEGGELIENAEYEAAKNEQAFVEGRIKELEILLATAHIIDEKPSAGKIVQVGSCVTIQEEGSKEKEEYFIVGVAEADPPEGKISNESPLGRSLLNHKEGDVIQVDAPAGPFVVKLIKVG